MERVYKELHEIRAEMEKLKEESQAKTNLSEGLWMVHNEQLIKFQEARMQIGKQVLKLNAKSEEISQVKQLCEDMKSCFDNKELFLRQLISANEKLRVDHGEKIQKLESENKELAWALDEATERIQDLEKNVCACTEEIDGLKVLSSFRQNKYLEAEQRTLASGVLKHREDMILEGEEENRNSQIQQDRKNEQFEQLEDPHTRLQNQFELCKGEWEMEKSVLLENIYSLQTKLESQTRISEDLQNQVRISIQALAYEEKRRKDLEVEVSEFSSRVDDICCEYEEAKSKIESLSLKRDEEIADLRNSLGAKETLNKEMGNKTTYLEQETQALHASLKEFQAAQIKISGTNSSMKKLQNKLESLEQLHYQCSINLKEKEVEWTSQREKLTEDMNGFVSELCSKNEQIQELQEDLEDCHSLLDIQNEELSLMLMIIKSEFSEACSNLVREKTEMEFCYSAMEEKILLLKEQTELKYNALPGLDADLEQKPELVTVLRERVTSIDVIEQQHIFMNNQIQLHKEMHDEILNCKLQFEKQPSQIENAPKEDSQGSSGKTNSELANKISEKKAEWEVNLEALNEVNESLVGIVKQQNEKMVDLQEQILVLESTITEKVEAVEEYKQKNRHHLQIAEEKNRQIENLQSRIAGLRHESAKRELEAVVLAQSETKRAFEQDNCSLLKVIKEKEQNIEDLLRQIRSLEQGLEYTTIHFLEKQIEIAVLAEALEKNETLMKLEIEEKNKTIYILEIDSKFCHQKMELQESSLFHLKQQAVEHEALFQANNIETKILKDQFVIEQKHLKSRINDLELQRVGLLEEIMKLSSHSKDFLTESEAICDQVGNFSCKDVELMEMLGKLLQNSEDENEPPSNPSASIGLYNSDISSLNPYLSMSPNGVKKGVDLRSPLKEVNL